MNGETLLDKAILNYKIALKNYQYLLGDERELNYVGYMLQQSAELAIKHYLEINGIRYARTHSIEDLLDECTDNGIQIIFSDEFYSFAPSISKWEAKTRYIKDYLVSKRQIALGFKLMQEFLVSNGVEEESLTLPHLTMRTDTPEKIQF